ncbi:hypothetical protein FRB97_008869, partial [Tulasnella sp. 331]
TFTATLEAVNWKRFDETASFVRSLQWDDREKSLDNEIFAQIFFHRPDLSSFFPNLTHITWKISSYRTALQLLPMLSPTVQNLTLHLLPNWLSGESGKNVQAITTILKRVHCRSLNLSEFQLNSAYAIAPIVQPLATFLGNQKKLTRIGLPELYTTAEVWSALRTLPCVEAVYMTNWQAGGDLERPWAFEEGTFPELTTLGWSSDNLEEAAMLLGSYTPPKLSNISFANSSRPGVPEVTAFISTLASACQGLASIVLNFFHMNRTEDLYTFKILSPLLRCRGLETLMIFDNKPILLQESDVQSMAAAWPRLRSLQITADPIDVIDEWDGTPLPVLFSIMHHFGRTLVHLGLWFNFKEDESINCWEVSSFLALRTLFVGLSLIHEKKKALVVAMLAGVCPAGVDLRAGLSPGAPIRDVDLAPEFRYVCEEFWKEAGDQIRDIHRFQRSVRYRLEMAEMENNRLRK